MKRQKTTAHIDFFIKGCSYSESELAASAFSSAAWRDYGMRQLVEVGRGGSALFESDLPLPYRGVGSYFIGLSKVALYPFILTGLDEAQEALEFAGAVAPPVIRDRAILSLRTVAWYRGNEKAEREFTSLAMRSRDTFTALEARRAAAIRLSADGNHTEAVRLLAAIQQSVYQSGNDYLISQYNNSLAVELLEIGSLDAALRLSQAAVASPLASAYPEWLQTRKDVLRAARARERRQSRISLSNVVNIDYFKSLDSDRMVVVGKLANDQYPRSVTAEIVKAARGER